MRVISMVPSWTETLLWAGVDVVGRTRFCIHPADRVASIPVVGGTKDIRWPKVAPLHPDLLLLDQEENPKGMAEASPVLFYATHVTGIKSLPSELKNLSSKLGNQNLDELANRVSTLLHHLPQCHDITQLPGIREWWVHPKTEIKTVLYVIWRNPWMIVTRDTFIGSVLGVLGVGALLPQREAKYPKIDLAEYDPSSTLLLFSTEPYPFAKDRTDLQALGYPCALVDGESYSWFGLRTVRFLEHWTGSFK